MWTQSNRNKSCTRSEDKRVAYTPTCLAQKAQTRGHNQGEIRQEDTRHMIGIHQLIGPKIQLKMHNDNEKVPG